MSDKIENMDLNFFQLVFSLQTAAMQQLGKIVSPVTGKIERDIVLAKTTIDILGMMEKKTNGNLTAEETRYIAHSLHELRLNYVDEIKKENKGGQNDGPSENISKGSKSNGPGD
ncbi:MAG: DUF1844 domain-containing protein [Candidatus Zixiibacteriota bacterium]